MQGDPLEEGPAGVQGEAQLGVPLEEREEGLVGVVVRLLEDAVEIADRLMVVNDDNQGHVAHDRVPASSVEERALTRWR